MNKKENKKTWRTRETWGETIKIGSLFGKYKNILRAPERSVIVAFCEVVADVLGFQIKESEVKYTPSTRTLTLRCNSALKSEIKLQEEEIFNHLKGRLGEQSAPKMIL